jgi:hypothetical protein
VKWITALNDALREGNLTLWSVPRRSFQNLNAQTQLMDKSRIFLYR